MLDSPGGVLRAWRQHRGLTQGDVAAELFVSTASVSAWETGSRVVPRESLLLLDAEYDAGGCLVDLVRSVRTPQGYQTLENGRLVPRPHRYWPHVFTSDPGPIWIWIRPAVPGPVSGAFHAGASSLSFGSSAEDGAQGLFLTFPRWSPMWPIHVTLDAPGWVDFGRGAVPSWVEAEARVVSAELSLEQLGSDPRERTYLLAKLRKVDRGDPKTLQARMRDMVGRERWTAGTGDAGLAAARLPGGDPGLRSQAVPEEQRDLHHRLRLARGLSRAEVASTVSWLLRHEGRRVSEDQVYNYEIGRRSRVKHLGALLDRVYDAGGWTCFEPVTVQRHQPGRFTVDFPTWWVGPVTVRVGTDLTAGAFGTIGGDGGDGPGADAIVRLASSRWHNERPLGQGRQSFTFCLIQHDDALGVSVPPGRIVRAFIGHDPAAVPIGRGWVPLEQDSDEGYLSYRDAILGLVGKTSGDLDRALGLVPVDG